MTEGEKVDIIKKKTKRDDCMSKKKTTAILVFLALLLCACSHSEESKKETAQEEVFKSYEAVVLEPTALGNEVIGDDVVSVDVSNKNQGYVIATYQGEMEKAMVQITGSDGVDYRYYLNEQEDAVLPFVCDSGSYSITAYENIEGTQYSFLWVEQLEVELEDSQLPFLYPNQYINFNSESQAVAKAKELDVDMETSLDTIQAIYDYVITNVEYDDEKAANVQSGYLPVVDETLKTGKGICFDYAALMTAMLRSRGIPTKLVIGYTADIYHAWINVYTKEQGWIDNIIKFDGEQWQMMDPTFAASNDKEETADYTSDKSNYIEKYVH
jgi:hypothetical protein